jgi:hypothetical protein
MCDIIQVNRYSTVHIVCANPQGEQCSMTTLPSVNADHSSWHMPKKFARAGIVWPNFTKTILYGDSSYIST